MVINNPRNLQLFNGRGLREKSSKHRAGLPDGTHIFKPQIPIWVNFGGPSSGRCWSILWTFGIFCGHLVHFVVILLYFFLFWYVAPRKIWQPCQTVSAMNKSNFTFDRNLVQKFFDFCCRKLSNFL
jgi:hypothetical protein